MCKDNAELNCKYIERVIDQGNSTQFLHKCVENIEVQPKLNLIPIKHC